MKAIILTAGIGKRLGDEIENLPKCLIKIGNETLLERQIKLLKELDIKDIFIVIGKHGDCWTPENIEKIKSIHKNIVINNKNVELKRPYSLFCGINEIENEDIIVLDGDLFFEKSLIEKIINDKRENMVLAKYAESKNLKDVGAKIILRNGGLIESIGYFPSNILFSGIFKIGKEDLGFFKEIVSNEEYWGKDLSTLINEFSKNKKVYVLIINPISFIKEKENKETESWEPVINWIERKDNIIRKKTKIGRLKLSNEVNFIKNLPIEIKKHFPKIIDHDFNGEFAYYDMEHCPYPSFIDLIFNQKISVEESFGILQEIFDFVFNKLYKMNIEETPIGFIKNSYFAKIRKRYAAIKGRYPLFDKIISTKEIIINGKKLKNFDNIITEMEKDAKFLSELEPPFITSYHGDFKFDNILINLETKDFILIDPRGKTAGGDDRSDILEDMAKLLTSCHAYYDIFRFGLFELKITEDKGVFIDYKIKTEKIKNFFDELTKKIIEFLPRYNQISEDKMWEKRIFFIEAMLLIASSPFLLTSKENEKLSIVIFARGIELLNEFIEKYPINKDKRFNLININTLEDYYSIKKLIL